MQDLYHQQQCIVGSCFRRLRRLRRRLPQEPQYWKVLYNYNMSRVLLHRNHVKPARFPTLS